MNDEQFNQQAMASAESQSLSMHEFAPLEELNESADCLQLVRGDIAQKILIFQNDIEQIRKYVTERCEETDVLAASCIIPCVYKGLHYTMYRIFDHFFVALQDGLCDDPQKAFLVRHVAEVQCIE